MRGPLDPRKDLSRLRAAAEAWQGIEHEAQPADRWLGNFFYQNRKKFGSRDRRFISQAVYNLFRHKTFLMLWAGHLFGGKPEPSLLIILSAYLDGLLEEGEADSLLRQIRRGAELSSVLKKLRRFELPPGAGPKSPEESLSIRYSFPLWLVSRWSARWGREKLESVLRIYEKRPPLIVRVNPLKTSREALLSRFRGRSLDVAVSKLSPWGIVFEERQAVFDWEEFRDGLFEVQDTGSQLVCSAVDARPGETVWDVCAGGGGKTLLLAALMQNKGRLVATDIRPQKLVELKKRAKRAGVFNVFPADLNRMKEMKAARSGFDKIVVDAPCSGTGTLRRNPDAKWKLSEERFESHKKDQLSIMRSVLPYLKKGGRLYYITCSLEPMENEEVMKEILETADGLRAVRPHVSFGEWTGFGIRLWPAEENDGFFIGVAEKV